MDYRMVTIRVVHVFLFYLFKKLKPFFLVYFQNGTSRTDERGVRTNCGDSARDQRDQKQLTKEQRQAVREYRRDVLGRTKQPVFEEWQQMARSIPSSHEF